MTTFGPISTSGRWDGRAAEIDTNFAIANSEKRVLDHGYAAAQAPLGLDDANKVLVKFGTGTHDTAFIGLSGVDTTVVELKQQRIHVGRIRLQPSRDTTPGVSHLIFQGEISLDNVIWNAAGDCVPITMSDNEYSDTKYIPVRIVPPQPNIFYRLQMARASTLGGVAGMNDGGLAYRDPTAVLPDFIPAPSARFELSIINENGNFNTKLG